MKKSILLAIFLFTFAVAHSQTFQWAKRIGAAANDVALAVTTDASGNVYVTGYFNGTVDIDPGPATLNFTSAGSQDCFITKFTSAGTLIWAKQIGGSSLEQGNAIHVDATGNVYVGGTFCTTVDFDPGAGVDNRTVTAATDAFILKLDASGNYVWVSCFSGTGNEQVLGVAVDAAGNVYSTGFWYETCDFDPGAGTYNIQASVTNSQNSCFITKLTSAGAFVWADEIGGGQFHQGSAIALDASGNVYVGGYTIGGTDYDPGAGLVSLPFGGGEDAFVCKLNSAGAYISAVKLNGTTHDRVNGLALDASGNVLITGFFNGTTDFDPSNAGVVNITTVGLKDIFIVKLTSALTYVWSKAIGGTADDQGTGIMCDASDNIYSAGYFQNTADFDPGAGTSNMVATGSYDAYLSKLNSSGNFTYAKKFGGTLGDYAFGVNVDGTGNSIYTVGHFGGTCDFDPDAGVYNLVSGGTQDLFIQKMGFCVVPGAPASSNTAICYNTSASLSATGTGTLGWYTASSGGTYLGGGTNYTTPALTATTSYYVQDSTCGASTRTQVVITVNPQINSSSTFTNVSCNGGSNGAATVTVTGGTSPYTYSWSPSGGTAATTTGRTAGTYTCTITDVTGCTRTQTVTITQPPAMTSGISASVNISCNGGSNGSATVLAGGGTPGYTYSWSPSGGTTATATGLSATSYTCTITDANGCTRTQSVALTQPTAITSSVSSQTNVSCNGGNNGAATVSVSGGTPGYSYSWAPSGGTSATTTGRTSGTYTCTITDANGCTRQQTVNITQPIVITSTVTAQTNVSCNGGSNGSATIGVGGGTPGYSYSWTPAGGTSATATGLSALTYTCTITDANGCTRQQTVTLTQPVGITSSVVSQTNVSCNGGSNGSATITAGGGAGGLTYSWLPSGGTGITITGRTAGIYTCTITDINGCSTTQTVNITQPGVLTTSVSSQTNISCNGGNDGSATVNVSGGMPTYFYSWSPSGGTSATAIGLTIGTYVCTITDANSCTTSQTVNITEPSALTANVTSQADPSCFGGTNGTANVNANGGTGILTYAWSPAGGTSATATGIGAGTFTCTITDANGCTASTTATLSEPTALVASLLSQTSPTCFGGNDGAATIDATGGTASYTYAWSPSGGNAATGTGFSIGTFTCIITDANGCTQTQSVFITQPAAIASSQTVTLCSGETLTVGASTYTVTGIYGETFTAFNGCDSTVTTDLTINSAIDVTTTLNINTLSSNQNGASYQWIDCLNSNTPVAGETNQSFTPAVNGDYAVIVTVGSCSDTSACTNVITGIAASESVALNLYPNPTNGVVTIQMNAPVSNAMIEVFNATGQLVKTEKPLSNSMTIELPQETGIYLIRVTVDGVSTTQKVIKE